MSPISAGSRSFHDGPGRMPEPAGRMPTLPITFFMPVLSHFVETMAGFLAEDPRLEVRVVTSLDRGSEFAEHPWSLERLRRDERIQVVSLDSPASHSELLIFGLVRHSHLHPALRGWLARSSASAIFPQSTHYESRLDWLRELMRAFPHFLRARFLILEREPRALDFRFGCIQRVFYTPSVHPQHLSDPRLRDAMCRPPPVGPRRFSVMFLGNRQPPGRTAVLESCVRELRAMHDIEITSAYPSERSWKRESLWMEYDHAKRQKGLAPLDYISALDETDFCISPPGWGRNWSHRTIEACLRGAIPVIEDPELYNLPFVDGENCVLARPADWPGAVRRCLASTTDEIARMRAGVLRLREERLFPSVAARAFQKAIRQRLDPGIESRHTAPPDIV